MAIPYACVGTTTFGDELTNCFFKSDDLPIHDSLSDTDDLPIHDPPPPPPPPPPGVIAVQTNAYYRSFTFSISLHFDWMCHYDFNCISIPFNSPVSAPTMISYASNLPIL